MKKNYLLIAFAVLLLAGGLILGTVFAAEGDGPSQGIWVTREAYDSKFISSADNTVIKSSPGILAGIKVTGGTMGTVTVYNGATCTGTVIDNAASTDIYPGLPMPYGIRMSNGICVYTSAATRLVVVYK